MPICRLRTQATAHRPLWHCDASFCERPPPQRPWPPFRPSSCSGSPCACERPSPCQVPAEARRRLALCPLPDHRGRRRLSRRRGVGIQHCPDHAAVAEPCRIVTDSLGCCGQAGRSGCTCAASRCLWTPPVSSSCRWVQPTLLQLRLTSVWRSESLSERVLEVKDLQLLLGLVGAASTLRCAQRYVDAELHRVFGLLKDLGH
eukprot:6209264-Pleurochrysis_carterae.AAC.1